MTHLDLVTVARFIPVCEGPNGKEIAAEPDGKCLKGTNTPKKDVVYVRDVVCKNAAGEQSVTLVDGECPEGSDLVCKDEKGADVASVEGKCPKGSVAKIDVVYEDSKVYEDGESKRVKVAIGGTIPAGVVPRPVLATLYPGLALCLLTGDPPQFKKSAE
jgi:hypothetical protein